MKLILLLAAAALVVVAPLLHAQNNGSVENSGRLQLTPGQLPPGPAVTEPSLMPAEVPQIAKPRASANPPAEKKSRTDASTEATLARVHLREARVKAERDPEVQNELARATKAKTDPERREALKKYYQLLYARIGKSDASIKAVADDRQKYSLRQLDLPRTERGEVPAPHLHDADLKPGSR